VPQPTATEGPAPTAPTRLHHRRFDLVLGIVLGIVLGLCIISAFVFLGSEGSIDAPRIKGVDTGKAAAKTAPAATKGTEPQPRP
jgi:hypothetical protein